MLTESGMNIHSIGDNGQAYGLGQWHPDRQANFARLFGHDIRQSTLEEQLAFKQAELNGTGGDQQSALAGSLMHRPGVTAGEAGAADSLYAERPGDSAGEARRRRALAEQLYLQYAPGADLPAAPAPDLAVSPAVPSAGGEAGPSGTGRIHITIDNQGKATADVVQQGDNFQLVPLPSRVPMTTRQGG